MTEMPEHVRLGFEALRVAARPGIERNQHRAEWIEVIAGHIGGRLLGLRRPGVRRLRRRAGGDFLEGVRRRDHGGGRLKAGWRDPDRRRRRNGGRGRAALPQHEVTGALVDLATVGEGGLDRVNAGLAAVGIGQRRPAVLVGRRRRKTLSPVGSAENGEADWYFWDRGAMPILDYRRHRGWPWHFECGGRCVDLNARGRKRPAQPDLRRAGVTTEPGRNQNSSYDRGRSQRDASHQLATRRVLEISAVVDGRVA